MKQITVLNQADGQNFTFYNNANGTILREFEGFEYSSVRDVIEDIAGPQSSTYITSKFGRRRFSWSGDLVSDSVFSLRRQMLAPLRQEGVLKLIKFTTYDDLELQCEAEIVKVINPYNHSVHTFLIEAIAPDWRFYSQTESSPESGDANQNIVNAGTEETDPVFRIYGPLTEVTVTNLSSSEAFTLNITLLVDEWVEINVRDRTVVLSDESSAYADFTGEFFSLVPGTNAILFEPTGEDVTTVLRTTFRDAYNGL